MQQRESMQYDVVIVGAGPAGLSTAIKLKQLAAESRQEIRVCVIEKGAEVGSHILSGAVLDTKALDELIPDWKKRDAPVTLRVNKDQFWFLTDSDNVPFPVPPSMKNKKNYIISLGQLARWLAVQAEEMGVEIYAGFSATEVLYHIDGSVKGIATGNMGVGKDGKPTDCYQQGIELHAHQTVFAEGCRGSLTQQIIKKFALDRAADTQTYGLGIKEIWEIDPSVSKPGEVTHTIGWPLDHRTYGGSFIYHLDNNQMAVGFVVGLDYTNPYLSPFEEFQRFKTHAAIKPLFKNARRIAYGARALNEGGVQSIPKLSFEGGVLVGAAAGFLNVPRIKGTHTAMKSGMLAAKSVFRTLAMSSEGDLGIEPTCLQQRFKDSWVHEELWRVRNIRPSFKWGLLPALVYSALDDYIFSGCAPWTLRHRGPDYKQMISAKQADYIDYPKPDGVLTFDRLSSVFLSGTNHEENQPVHLQLKTPALAIDVNYAEYDSPETRYCPAGVYEIVDEQSKPRLQINAQNCVHCKTCDIKDPLQNINWVCPEGSGGPNYEAM